MSSELSNKDSEKELVVEIKLGNEEAFKKLFISYFNRLINFAMYKVRSLEIAKDLVQEIFMKVWINRDRLDPEKSIKAYLYKSLTNQIVNLHKHSSSNIFSLNESASPYSYYPQEIEENQIDIFNAIEKLPEKFKTAFLLSRVEGFKYHEIAEICEISVKAVEKRMSKALKILRNELLD